jgi:hypothetical protein
MGKNASGPMHFEGGRQAWKPKEGVENGYKIGSDFGGVGEGSRKP